ncbi:phage tail tube protein [Schleiferilactobacillus shenzhenensis]|uniref:Uncharacterized protein n=1 Tax=Schleiferilactobacillus shenzhenensis LY-73 TaxID=1231336 RepID=U4THW6_9LACO|nr:phage tail tube protein [Schleiferilactobacillus shenzhenensis]ERL63764.1 hypothetical protein L248_2181 [Schleiferilactobacillus shenzhenensis LY-73]
MADNITNVVNGDKQILPSTVGRDADKILYFWKRIQKYPRTKKIRILGLMGATSGTNTRNLSSTQTKTVTLKGVGSINQQRVVDVIFAKGQEDFREFKQAWQGGELIGLWRVDFNTVTGTKPNRTVQAEYSECYIPNLPVTEALGGIETSNITFEVNGQAVDTLADGVTPATLNESDFEDGQFDIANQFYGFKHGQDIGAEDFPDSGVTPATDEPGTDTGTGKVADPKTVTATANATGADVAGQ